MDLKGLDEYEKDIFNRCASDIFRYRHTANHIHLWNEERNVYVTVSNNPEFAKEHTDGYYESGEARERAIHCGLKGIESQVAASSAGSCQGARARAWRPSLDGAGRRSTRTWGNGGWQGVNLLHPYSLD